MSAFYNITKVNGFDYTNLDNARQNNYAWSMSELNGYLYVGTGRNIVYQPVKAIFDRLGIETPPILTPDNPNNDAEIWRYPIRERCHAHWELVYKAPSQYQIMGFREMITYKDSTGQTSIYAAGFTITGSSYMLASSDGRTWTFVPPGVPAGQSTRAMHIHRGLLYMGATNTTNQTQATNLFVTNNPRVGWTQVVIGTSENDPRGEIQSIATFNNQLYIGTAPDGGFEIWRTRRGTPNTGDWKLVVDKGAGDELNELPLSMAVFRNNLYVGTGIWASVMSVDSSKVIVPPKGFDIIKINDCDKWKVVVGQKAIWPTNPTTGVRNIGRYPSGFGNMFNSYCWQLTTYEDQLYVGTWDSSILWATILRSLFTIGEDGADLTPVTNLEGLMAGLDTGTLRYPSILRFNIKDWLLAFATSLERLPEEFGFDLFRTIDGRRFEPQTLDGFDNRYNYGARNLFAASDGHLYLGTANPFEGCEVWVK
ncbi:MAG: hypothetical protein K0R15_2610 [Clostridiales bacterium]|jgi:hypothetical protein|nr:hypothetical protein [Clostridiales bacterium]